ncbi:MAG: peptide-binding protein [Candidatus Schekmanbacteria bacterium]|nr:MAG: peptide-binding protein [Candidatus Schekmanbacteria bacterium]
MKPTKIFLIFILAFFIILPSCGKRQEKSEKQPIKEEINYEPAYGDTIVEGSIGQVSTLIPQLASDSASHEVADLIYNGLVRYNKDLIIEGVLADSWKVSEDGLRITFHLKKQVKWHDGAPFTAKDVLFTYNLMIDPKTPTAYKEDFLRVKKVEVPDDYTFVVIYDKPFAPALISWSISILPSHILEGQDITKTDFGRNPIGTGPYKFEKWESDRIILKANDDYFEGRPYIDRVIYRVIPDNQTMFLELKGGGIDWMGLTPIQYKRQTETDFFRKNFQKFRYPSFSYTYLGYNLKDEKFKDKRVRQALSYAINRQEIIDGVLLGLGREATGPYLPDMWVYNPNVKRYPYDKKKALELLTEAGWKDTDNDGFLDKNGKKFQFTIITNQGNSMRARTGEIIQKNLHDIGIDVKLRIIEWAAFLKDFINKRKFEAVILGWSVPRDPDLYDVWHSSKTGPEELNFVSYSNPEVDELLEKGRSVFDQEERKKYYYRIQEILAEDQPYTFLYVPDALPAIHKRFKNIKPAPAGITYNFIRWYVPKELQKYSITP